jgi:hypothetical protein
VSDAKNAVNPRNPQNTQVPQTLQDQDPVTAMNPASAGPVEQPVCSAKGCRAPAVWVLAWNNPKLHTPERRKTWLACDEHREHLSQFLGMRGFLKDVVTLAEWERRPEGGSGDGTPGTEPGSPGTGNPESGSAADR